MTVLTKPFDIPRNKDGTFDWTYFCPTDRNGNPSLGRSYTYHDINVDRLAEILIQAKFEKRILRISTTAITLMFPWLHVTVFTARAAVMRAQTILIEREEENNNTTSEQPSDK